MINAEVNPRVKKRIEGERLIKIVRRALCALGVKNAEISIAIVGDAEMKRLNREWRGKNKITDVLSFDYSRSGKTLKTTLEDVEIYGEIIICYPQAARQARQNFVSRRLGGERGHSVKEEIKMLLIHGLLHLCGYDHEGSAGEAEKMGMMEQRILNQKSKT